MLTDTARLMNRIPEVNKADHPTVARALKAAASEWSHGKNADALRSLRKAAEAASDVDDDVRSLELAKAAANLATELGTVRAPIPPPLNPAAPGARAAIPRPQGSTPAQPLQPGRVSPPAVAKQPAPVAKQPAPVAKQPAPQRLRRAPTIPPLEEATDAHVLTLPPQSAPLRGKANSVTELSEVRASNRRGAREPRTARTPSMADEIDAWPTEVVAGTAIPDLTATGTGVRPSPHAPAVIIDEGAQRPTQAMAVELWRDRSGVHIARAGAEARRGAVSAILVATDPEINLADFFSLT